MQRMSHQSLLERMAAIQTFHLLAVVAVVVRLVDGVALTLHSQWPLAQKAYGIGLMLVGEQLREIDQEQEALPCGRRVNHPEGLHWPLRPLLWKHVWVVEYVPWGVG